MKICTVCKLSKPFEDFYNCKASKDGRSWRCRSCDIEAGKAYRGRHKHRDKVNRRYASIKCRYGLTRADYEAIVEAQNNRCPICGGELNHDYGIQHKPKKAVVDHCHETGRIRGILCTMCNKGIGLIGDNVEALERALAYLKSSDVH